MKLILGSSSPRRRQLLEQAGVKFDIVTAEAEESFIVRTTPESLCEENAFSKANAVSLLCPQSWVIGADTLVFLDNLPLGKPADEEEARETLRKLSGRTHFVCTGVALVSRDRKEIFSVKTEVRFKKLSDQVISSYMSQVNVFDKAGSYACQEHGDMIIDDIQGDTDNVIGLPVNAVLERLRLLGLLQ